MRIEFFSSLFPLNSCVNSFPVKIQLFFVSMFGSLKLPSPEQISLASMIGWLIFFYCSHWPNQLALKLRNYQRDKKVKEDWIRMSWRRCRWDGDFKMLRKLSHGLSPASLLNEPVSTPALCQFLEILIFWHLAGQEIHLLMHRILQPLLFQLNDLTLLSYASWEPYLLSILVIKLHSRANSQIFTWRTSNSVSNIIKSWCVLDPQLNLCGLLKERANICTLSRLDFSKHSSNRSRQHLTKNKIISNFLLLLKIYII